MATEDHQTLRIAMMGMGEFALPTFHWLVESEHEVAVLITRPARPAGRSRKSIPSPLQEVAQAHQVPIWEPDRINADDSIDQLRQWSADLFLVCDYGQILSAEALGMAKLGGINLHGSLLPQYRGAAPVQWAIFHGEKTTGVSVIHMTPRLDAGPILAVRQTEIEADDDAVILESRLAELGVDAVAQSISKLQTWDGTKTIGTPQDESLVSPAPRLTKTNGQIDFMRSAQSIHLRVRAMKPWPGCYTAWERKPGLWLPLIIEETSLANFHPLDHEPGSIVRCTQDHLWLATGDGTLAIHRLRPAGKRSMSTSEFLRGYGPNEGTRWQTHPTS